MMQWKRRRGSGGRQTIKDFSHEALKKHAMKLLYNRWQLLTPVPLEPNDMWNALLTEEQHKAFAHIQETMPTALSCGTQLFLKFDLPLTCKAPITGTAYKPDVVELTLPESRPIPDTNVRYGQSHKLFVSQLPREMRAALLEWIPRWLWTQGETNQVLAKLDELFKVCNTMGHVKRVWPNVATMLPERAQLKLAEAKVKSPYPPGVLEPDGDTQHWKLKPEWRPEALAWYDERLTEAMCLPLEFDEISGQVWRIEIETKPA